MIFFFAWVNEGVAFDPDVHNVEDEQIFALALSHAEGDFPALSIELVNPRAGLLSAGRKQWCWLAWDNGGGVEPLFNGRLVAVPQRLSDEVVSLEFVARPPDVAEQKEALAASLRVLPYFDPVWLQERLDDPDAVLEARTALWHFDRLTLEVTASNIVAGEDGVVEIGEADHLYEETEVSYGEAPLRRVALAGTVSWTQAGSGELDLTRELVNAFRTGGSPYAAPIVCTMTGDGLLSSWPEPGANIGGGWSVGLSSSIAPAVWLQEGAYVVRWIDRDEDVGETVWQNPAAFAPGGTVVNQRGVFAPQYLQGFKTWQAAFPATAFKVSFQVRYDAARERSETVSATLEADVQPLLVDPGSNDQAAFELSSTFVGEPVDPANALPIGDLRRNSYFKTARGQQSFQYLLLLARARLIARARAVRITLATTWAIAAQISCRKSVRLVDYRLPGGEATGKVAAYSLTASGEGEIKATVELACTIGYGIALGAAAGGTGVYAQPGYMLPGYQQMTGRQETVIAGELLYEAFDIFEIADDDGIDLFDMSARTVVNALTVANGPGEQMEAIDAGRDAVIPDPTGALQAAPTVVTLDLKPVEGGAFHVDFAPQVEDLVVPLTIDLAAAA